MKKYQKLLALALTLLMVVGVFPTAAFAVETPDAAAGDLRYAYTASESTAVADPDEWVTVIVELDGATTLDKDEFVKAFRQSSKGFSADATVAAYRTKLVQQHEAVASQITAINSEAGFRYHYTNILNGFAATVQRKDIAAVEALDGVLNVYECQTYQYDKDWENEETIDGEDLAQIVTSDSGSIDQLDLQEAWDAGYTGKGKVVGVFDSSLRYTHKDFSYMDPEITAAKPDNYKTKEGLLEAINANADTINLFNSDWGSWFHGREETGFSDDVQAAIKNGDFWYSEKVPFTVDYFDGDLEVWDGDTSSHGTHVCGIAAGNPGPNAEDQDGVKGAAYDAQIMFFKVFSEYDDFAQESDEAVFAALDDAVTLGVNTFNLSLGIDFGFSTMQSYAQGGYQKAYIRAQAAGISVAVSAGNSQRTQRNLSTLVNGATTVLPNKYSLGFSGSMMAPMTVASAHGAGYTQYSDVTNTTITFTGVDPIVIQDDNATPFGEAFTGTYDVVDIGLGSEEEILAATGAEKLEGALAGKVAFVTRGDLTFLLKGENAYKAGAVALVMMDNTANGTVLSAAQKYAQMPTIGAFSNRNSAAVKAAVADGAKVSFTSETTKVSSSRSYSDSGPSSYTSWGVTEALELKPDIMTPGGNILSTGAASDTALSIKSGTSMASPNMSGAFVPVQQYVDANLDVFGVEKGTQEYSNIINQLVASNTKVYMRSGNAAYHSTRRQGAGMPQIGDIVNSKVVLHSNVAYDPLTGEAPRTKVNLYDQLGDTFDITFNLDNYNDEARTFDVKANVQTDGTTVSAGRTNIGGGADNNAFSFTDAVITVKSVSGDAKIDTASENVNQFAEGFAPTTITVPAKSKTTVTVTVALNADTMAGEDAKWPNGQFIEGFIFFNSEANENVSIPYMGFRGDWNQAPIFDFDSIYDDYSEKATTDLDYPLFAVSSLSAKLPDGSQAMLGASQFSGVALPDYYTDGRDANRNYSYQAIRKYAADLKDAGMFSADYASFSPNEDGFMDTLNANLGLLRNAKALAVEVVDAEGNVVATLGPDYDYFLAYQGDGLLVQQIAQTEDGPYSHTMGWDGKDADGNVVPDGTYTYKVYAITEYQFLKALKGQTSDPKDEDVLAAVKGEGSQSFEMGFSVDTTAPEVTANEANGKTWNVTLTDEVGIQAVGLYYNGALVGDIIPVNDKTYEGSFDLASIVNDNQAIFETGSVQDVDLSNLQLQAIDFAFNRTTVEAAPAVTVTPEESEVAVGDELVLTVECETGALGDIAWCVADNADLENAEVIEGATEATLTVDTSAAGTYYYAAQVGDIVSNVAVVVVNEPEKQPCDGGENCPSIKLADVDRSETSWYHEAVDWAFVNDITKGTTETTFSPDQGCTRAQAVTFLWRAKGQPEPTTTENPFTDVAADAYYAKAVLWAVETGVTKGTSETTFSPDDTCTRAQIVTFLWRAEGEPEAAAETSFTDVPADSWFAGAVAWAVENDVTKGTSETTFAPNDTCTRAQIVTFLWRDLA